MKKAISILLVILCFLPGLSLIRCDITVNASPTTWTVDDDGPPANFTNIQEAINSADPGDTIFVRVGTYYENVVINKTVVLVGEDVNSTIIDGRGIANVIYITADSVSVTGFTIRRSGRNQFGGVFVEYPSMGNVLNGNKIVDNYEGVSIHSSSSNLIYGNTISNNYYGISLYSSSNNMISNNSIFSSNYDGIYLSSSTDNVISRNMILNNNIAGMSLYYSSNNVVCCNTVSNNSYYGINLALLSSDNTIYRNNFNNTEQVWGVSTNIWNHTDEGNYWSDYTGQDLNGDGIGDDPYYIDENNQDNRPLMGVFSAFDFTWKGGKYNATIVSNSTIRDFNFQIGTETGNKIIRFNATGADGSVGFSRVTMPAELMKHPYVVLVDDMEIAPTLLNISDVANVCLYFTYFHKNYTIKIISSEALHLYYELLAKYLGLQEHLYNLNATYYALLNNYTRLQEDVYNLNDTCSDLLINHIKLQIDLYTLRIDLSYLNETYYGLLTNYVGLSGDLDNLNATYHSLLDGFNSLLVNYTALLQGLDSLSASYQSHLEDYSGQMQNIRSLTYIFAATITILIAITIYLSRSVHANVRTRAKMIED